MSGNWVNRCESDKPAQTSARQFQIHISRYLINAQRITKIASSVFCSKHLQNLTHYPHRIRCRSSKRILRNQLTQISG